MKKIVQINASEVFKYLGEGNIVYATELRDGELFDLVNLDEVYMNEIKERVKEPESSLYFVLENE